MSLVANIAHDSIDLVRIKFNTSLVERHPSWTFAWVDFSVARNIITIFYRAYVAASSIRAATSFGPKT